ncbi:MAG: AI-2E family transporter [Thermodesulfobacteriota bacterium]
MVDKPTSRSNENEESLIADGSENLKISDLAKVPFNVPSIALIGLFIFASIYTLQFARAIVLPIVLSLLLSLLLAPVVRGMKELKIPETVSSAFLLLAFIVAIGFGFYSLSDPAIEWIAKAPESFRAIESKLRKLKKPVEEVTKVTEQAEQLTKIEEEIKPQTVEVKEQTYSEILFSQTRGLIIGIVLVITLLFFLLASGDLFLLKLVKLLPRLKDKKQAVDIARQTERDISAYLITVTVINIGLGLAIGFAMFLLKMPNPILWGVMAGLLNYIPYIGSLTGIFIVAIVSSMTFEDLGHVILVPLSYLVLTALEGNIITPLIHGRRFAVNPLIIFLSLIFWGWIWGIPGALIAVPMTVIFKIVCDHIESLNPIGEFLGK